MDVVSYSELVAEDSMENDTDSNVIVEDSFKNDGHLNDDEKISFFCKKKAKGVLKSKRKPLIDLNKLPEEAIEQPDLEEHAFNAFAIVEDSLEKDAHSNVNDEEISSLKEEEFTGNRVEQPNDPPPMISSASNSKVLIDLNEYPEEGPDFGFNM